MQLDSLTGTVQSRSVALEFYRNVTEEIDVHAVNYCLSRPPLLWREWATEIRQHAPTCTGNWNPTGKKRCL